MVLFSFMKVIDQRFTTGGLQAYSYIEQQVKKKKLNVMFKK